MHSKCLAFDVAHMKPFIFLALVVIVDIIITHQAFGQGTKAFFFLTCYCKPFNLRFIIFSLPSTMEQTFQCTMWILAIVSTTSSTQGNWATHFFWTPF
jgi:hypothetical protein